MSTMNEINRFNFKEKLPQIKESLEKCKFVSIDLEFSALQPLHNQHPSLFDTNEERYTKLAKNLQNVVPVQVGLTAFHFDNQECDYFGEVFSFYVQPSAFGNMDKSFYFQASTLQFLTLHNFDFNKFARAGIFFLNSNEEAALKCKLANGLLIGENCILHVDLDNAIQELTPKVSKWFKTSKIDDELRLPEILAKYNGAPEIIYFLHKSYRVRFKDLWTYVEDDVFCFKKVTPEDYENLSKTCQLDNEILATFRGFREIFELLTRMKKPIIGHNLLQDLMIIINCFEIPLPPTYSEFKRLSHELFPTIFDTKVLYYELRRKIPKEKLPDNTGLDDLFHYFRDGIGRHLVPDTSAIECNIINEQFHEAGWDSFCAGYIFLRMATFNISQEYPRKKIFATGELMAGLSHFKNRVNVIRGSTSCIRLDGEDQKTTRPSWLVVESKKNEPVDLTHLTSLLSCYGFVDVKKITAKGNKVLVAVDTFRTAREISRSLNVNQKFQVMQYNFLKHSPLGQTFILATLAVSGTILAWLTHKIVKNQR